MAIPEARETERGRYLQRILDATIESEWADWPQPTKDDFAIIGAVIVIFSYVDFNLRRLIEVCEHVDMIPQYKGKTSSMHMAEVSKVVKELPIWDENAKANLENIEELRKMRNLMAHFVVRRFPNDNAFMFTAKSARDYRRVFNKDPVLGISLTAVADVDQIKEGLKILEIQQQRLATTTAELENQYLKLKPYVAE
jgi:hypothetical protein